MCLSGPAKPSRPWYNRLKDWAFGSTRQAALDQVPAPAQPVRVALQQAPAEQRQQPPPPVKSDQAPQEILASLQGMRPGERVQQLATAYSALQSTCPQHVELARTASRAADDNEPLGLFAVAVLRAGLEGKSLEEAALAGLDAIPSGYPSNAARIGLAVAQNLPSQQLARAAVQAVEDSTVKNCLIRAGLQSTGKPAGQRALAMLEAIPGNYPSNKRMASDALMKELSQDPELGPAIKLASKLGRACDDASLPSEIHLTILKKRLQGEQNPGKLAMAGIASISSNYPSNRSMVVRAAIEELQDDPNLAGYARLGKSMTKALEDSKLAAPIGLSVIESGLGNLTLAQTARAAMDVIPSSYPTNKNLVGKAVLQALAESPDVQLAQRMVDGSDDTGCQNGMILAALEIVTGEQKDPLVVTGQKLLATIPSNYPTNRKNVGNALLKQLRTHYTDPDARAKIDRALQSPGEIDAVLQELVNSKTAAEEVAALAGAVTGKENKAGIEERGSVVVIGGVRVKVKSQ
ncbi:MAG: hypothetical protein AMXMBFR33_69420 [Candidatus Xenobia bacterium]